MITGGGRGIGRALALGFLRAGARVAVLTRGDPPDFELARSDQERFCLVLGDVTMEPDVRAAIEMFVDRFGRIDVLINNAGINRIAAFADADFGEWAGVIDVNLKGTALVTHRVLPLMIKERYGRIINVVSRSAEDPVRGRTAYSASKAGVIAFTKVLARELAEMKDCDILVNGLIPGSTRTNVQTKVGQDPEMVFPFCRKLAELPAGGPNGRFFWKGRDYPMYSRFNLDAQRPKRYWAHLPSWFRR